MIEWFPREKNPFQRGILPDEKFFRGEFSCSPLLSSQIFALLDLRQPVVKPLTSGS